MSEPTDVENDRRIMVVVEYDRTADNQINPKRGFDWLKRNTNYNKWKVTIYSKRRTGK